MQELSKKISDNCADMFWQFKELPTSKLEFSEAVLDACKANYCGNYGKTWTCPPNGGTPEELKQKVLQYDTAFVFTTKHDIEDSFDIEGMLNARYEHDKAENAVRKLLPPGCLVLSAGACNVCKKCAYPSVCRFPDKAKYSIEACGINVLSLAKAANINYINGKDTVTYFSAILFNK